jgi:transketolase
MSRPSISDLPRAMRDTLLEKIWEGMLSNRQIYFVTADFGSPVLDKIRRDFPDRFINVGIAEQSLINVSCGLALEGFIVFAYAIAPFLTMRCFEQIRVSIALLSEVRPMNVNLIGVGAGYSYTLSGPTHQCYEDITLMRGLPNIHVYSPSDHLMSSALFDKCMNENRPKYLRLDAQILPVLHNQNIVSDKGFIIRKEGKGLCLIATGFMVHTALALSVSLISDGIDTSIVDVFDLSDFNREALVCLLKQHKQIVTMEEGFRGRGGLDAALFELIAREKINVSILNLGVEPAYSFNFGSRQEIHERVGIGPETARTQILSFFKP